jgi:hypothetical protein
MTGVRIPPEQRMAIEAYAKGRNIKLSDAIRELIEMGLNLKTKL